MPRYLVEVTFPSINHAKPDEPILWHLSVEARSEVEAVWLAKNSRDCRDMPARVVPTLTADPARGDHERIDKSPSFRAGEPGDTPVSG